MAYTIEMYPKSEPGVILSDDTTYETYEAALAAARTLQRERCKMWGAGATGPVSILRDGDEVGYVDKYGDHDPLLDENP